MNVRISSDGRKILNSKTLSDELAKLVIGQKKELEKGEVIFSKNLKVQLASSVKSHPARVKEKF